MLLHIIGELTGEADVDRIAALPLDVIMDWRDYINWKHGDEQKGNWITNPAHMLAFLKAKIPDKR